MMNKVYALFAGIIILFSTVASIFYKGKKVGKEEKTKEIMKEVNNAYEEAHKIKQDVARMSDSAIDDELRKFWTEK